MGHIYKTKGPWSDAIIQISYPDTDGTCTYKVDRALLTAKARKMRLWFRWVNSGFTDYWGIFSQTTHVMVKKSKLWSHLILCTAMVYAKTLLCWIKWVGKKIICTFVLFLCLPYQSIIIRTSNACRRILSGAFCAFDSRQYRDDWKWGEKERWERRAAKVSGEMRTGGVPSHCGTFTSRPSWCSVEKDLELLSAVHLLGPYTSWSILSENSAHTYSTSIAVNCIAYANETQSECTLFTL